MGICSKSLAYAFVICIGSALMGNVGAYTSPAGKKIRDKHNLSDEDFGWIFYSSIAFLTAAIGPFVTKFLLKIFKGKRKNTLFVISVFSLASWALNCLTSVNIYAGWFSRALLGITVGSFSSICPMYLVEIAPPGYAGFYGSLNTIGAFFGQAIFSFLGPFVDYMGFNILAVIFSALLGITCMLIPESPHVSASGIDTKPKISIFQKKYLGGMFIGFGMMFLQQFSGICGILTTLADIFREAGLDLDPNYQSGISILLLLFSNVIGSFTIDKLGQKLQWSISASLASIGCILMALGDKYNWSPYLPLASIFIYNIGFGFGLNSIPWIIAFQLFSPEVRETGSTLCVVSNWCFAFLIVMIFPSIKASIGMFGAMIVFAVDCAVAAVYGLVFIKNVDTNNDGAEVSNLDESDNLSD